MFKHFAIFAVTMGMPQSFLFHTLPSSYFGQTNFFSKGRFYKCKNMFANTADIGKTVLI